MAIVGGAVLTPAMGLVSEAFHGVAPAHLLPLVAYVYVAQYAFFGATPSEPRVPQSKTAPAS
jgi:MFS transporter, FHS family, L-fucose permease